MSLERDMRGRWILNGAPLVLSQDGQVLDGRARLHACAAADVSFETLVVRGVVLDTFETIDSVRKRTLVDVLSIRRAARSRAGVGLADHSSVLGWYDARRGQSACSYMFDSGL